ncbi:MAG: hypothetical protein RIB59_14170 [Rhodospirillales bacterium]
MKGEPISTALVTIAIGERHQREFETCSLPTLRAYAKKHGYELIVLTEPFAPLDPDGRKTVHWHKILIGQVPAIRPFDRVIWIDTDIMINPRLAPDIAATIPADKIGVVEMTDGPQLEAATETLNTLYNIVMREHYGQTHAFVKPSVKLKDYYLQAGLTPAPDKFCNTGVMVFSPKHHNDFLASVFLKYEKNFDDYENTPLSFEIFSNGLNAPLDPRFNVLWSDELALKYPFLARKEIIADFYERRKSGTPLDGGPYAQWYTWCTNASYQSAYFLHFSGGRDNPLTKVPMRFVRDADADVFGAVFPEYDAEIRTARPSAAGKPFSLRADDT